MNKKDDIREELREHSPFLSKLKDQEEAFKVPKGYFKSLPDEIMRQIKAEENPISPQSSPSILDQLINQLQWLLQPRPALALASIAVLIAIGISFLGSDNIPTTENDLWADISSEEINQYVASNIEDFDTDLLIETGNIDPDWELNTMEDLEEEELDMIIDELIDDISLEDIEDVL